MSLEIKKISFLAYLQAKICALEWLLSPWRHVMTSQCQAVEIKQIPLIYGVCCESQ